MTRPITVVQIEVAIEAVEDIKEAIQETLNTARQYGAAGVTGAYQHRDMDTWVSQESRDTITIDAPIKMTFD